MKVIVQVQVKPNNPDTLLEMVKQFNLVCNWLAAIAFNERIWHWLPLQKRAYREIRNRYGFTANQTLVAIRKVAYAYKVKEYRADQTIFNIIGSMPIFQHVYYDDNTVMFYGLRMPYVVKEGIKLPRHPQQGVLSYSNGKFYIYQSINIESPEEYKPDGFLGCDLGVKNILADSQSELYSSVELNGLRKRNIKLRSRLQRKGTRSSKRLLKRRRRGFAPKVGDAPEVGAMLQKSDFYGRAKLCLLPPIFFVCVEGW
jgi:putative transposase